MGSSASNKGAFLIQQRASCTRAFSPPESWRKDFSNKCETENVSEIDRTFSCSLARLSGFGRPNAITSYTDKSQ